MNRRILSIFILFLAVSTSVAYAQRTVERYENGEKKYQGREVDGVKVGKHTFWHEDGSKKREEKYNERGILVQVREWDSEGNLTKDENPEEGFEKVRKLQFDNMVWTDVADGIAYSKVKGDDIFEPIEGRTEMLLHYATFLTDGTEVDNSFRAKSPIIVNFKKREVIEGFQKGLTYFEVGDNGYIRVPARLAYGEEGTNNVPPDATLIFQVHIFKVK